jgi:hypothetical protein
MPQCQFPVFCCFCVLEKLHRKYSWNWTKQKPNVQKLHGASRSSKRRRRRRARGQPHQDGVRPKPWPCPPVMRPTWSPPDAATLPIKTPRREKPKYPIRIPERYRVPPLSLTRDREGPEALPRTLPKRGIATEGLLHHHACLRSDE